MSSFLDIVKAVGSGVVTALVPGGGAIVNFVNSLLGDGDKLPEDATGSDLMSAVESLPPSSQVEVLNKQFDVDITLIKEKGNTLRTMLDNESKSTHTTRPYIAKGSFHVVAFAIIMAVSIWSYGVIMNDVAIVKTVMDGWPFMLALIGPLVALLNAYFGVLRNESKERINAASGNNKTTGILGAVTSVIGAIRK